jgi:hypothetical protein
LAQAPDVRADAEVDVAAGEAEQMLERLVADLERSWTDAAASLREGLAETLTLMGLGIDGKLAKTQSSTNACESMIEIVRHTQRNVKRWQNGDMRERWTVAGMLQAEQQFRRIIGHSDLAKLVIESNDATSPPNTPTPRSAPSASSPPLSLPSEHHNSDAIVAEVPRRTGQASVARWAALQLMARSAPEKRRLIRQP